MRAFAMPDSVSSEARRAVLVLFSAQAMSTGATTLSVALGSILATRLAGSDSFSGVPGTLNLIASAFAAYGAGQLMARHGRRLGLTAGYLLGASGALIGGLMAMAGSFPGFLVGSAMVGGAAGFIAQSRYAAAEMVPAAVRGRTVGLMLFGSVIGAVSSAALTPGVRRLARSAEIDSIELSWLVGSLFLAFGALLVGLLFRPAPPAPPAPTLAASEPESMRSRGAILALPAVRLAMLSLIVGQGVMVMLMNLIPLHGSHHGHELPALSLIMSVHFVGMFGFAWLTGGLVDARGPRAVSALGGVQILVGALIATLSTGAIGIGISMFLIGLGWNFCYVAGSTLLSQQLHASERSRIQGTVDFLGYLAAALCVAGGGVLFGIAGFEAVAGVGMAAAIVLLLALWDRGGRRVPTAPEPAVDGAASVSE